MLFPLQIFGGAPNTNIPICLAYNLSHYEELVPLSDHDIDKTVQLCANLLSGKQIPVQICVESSSSMVDNKEEKNFKNPFRYKNSGMFAFGGF